MSPNSTALGIAKQSSYTLSRGKKTEDMISTAPNTVRAGAWLRRTFFLIIQMAGFLWISPRLPWTRRAYRDGHNDYLLNDQQVRLRDLNELLAASGLADRTYTILGQDLWTHRSL